MNSTNDAIGQAKRKLKISFIPHDLFDRTLTTIIERIKIFLDGDTVPCLHIAGPSRVGKSTMIKKIDSLYPRVKDARTVRLRNGIIARCDYIPVLHFDMPSSPSLTAVLKAMLKALGDPYYFRGSVEELIARIKSYIKACGTVAVLIDDTQRVVDLNGMVVRQSVGFFLQELHDNHNIFIVLFGLGRARFLFDQDTQIQNRFDSPIRFDPYRWDKEMVGETLEFLGIVKAYRKAMKLEWEDRLRLEDPQIGIRFFYATQGLIGLLRKLFEAVLRVLEEDGTVIVTMNILDRAFRRSLQRKTLEYELLSPFTDDYDGSLPPPLPDHYDLLRTPTQRARTSPPTQQALPKGKGEINRALHTALTK